MSNQCFLLAADKHLAGRIMASIIVILFYTVNAPQKRSFELW